MTQVDQKALFEAERAYADGANDGKRPMAKAIEAYLSALPVDFLAKSAKNPAPAESEMPISDRHYDLRKAAEFLLWQYDRGGPILESEEAWEALRASMGNDGGQE